VGNVGGKKHQQRRQDNEDNLEALSTPKRKAGKLAD